MSAAHSHPGQRGLLNPPPQRLDPDRPAEPPARVDPLDLMETAARNHWRAAAWLLERTRPEEYGRKSASAAPRRQVEAALLHVLAAALETAAPSQRDQTEAHVFAACQRAFASCFPAVAALSPLDLPAEAMLSPKTDEATTRAGDEASNHDGTTSTTEDNAELVSPPSDVAEALGAPPAVIVSPKIAEATECPATELPAVVESPPAAVPESQLLSLQRHADLRRRAQLQLRKQQAAAKRKKRAAKKQARAARRRAA
jgi:hypothetical protein